MGFNLRSGNSSGLKFKEMGSSPTRWVDIAMSAIGSLTKKDDGGKKEEDKAPEPPKIEGAKI